MQVHTLPYLPYLIGPAVDGKLLLPLLYTTNSEMAHSWPEMLIHN